MKLFFWMIVLAFFAQITLTILAFRHFEWWLALLSSFVLFVSLIRLLYWLASFLFFRYIKKIEASATKEYNIELFTEGGAYVTVNSIEPAEVPEEVVQMLTDPSMTKAEQEEFATQYANLAWQAFDVTVVPGKAKDRESSTWSPDLLGLMDDSAPPPPSSMQEAWQQAKTNLDKQRSDEDDSPESEMRYFDMYELELATGEQFHSVKEGRELKREGAVRVRFIAGIPRPVSRLKVLYYNRPFATIDLHIDMKPDRPLLPRTP